MTKKTITALMVAPGMEPCVIKLYKDMKYLQRAVSVGMDEVYSMHFFKFNSSIGIFYTDDAPIGWARCNRRIGSKTILGVFYVVGLKNGKLCSLSSSDIEEYTDRFWEIETFSDMDSIEAFLDRICPDENS